MFPLRPLVEQRPVWLLYSSSQKRPLLAPQGSAHVLPALELGPGPGRVSSKPSDGSRRPTGDRSEETNNGSPAEMKFPPRLVLHQLRVSRPLRDGRQTETGLAPRCQAYQGSAPQFVTSDPAQLEEHLLRHHQKHSEKQHRAHRVLWDQSDVWVLLAACCGDPAGTLLRSSPSPSQRSSPASFCLQERTRELSSCAGRG